MLAGNHIGIIPLYIGWDEDGVTHVASEMKALDKICDKIQSFTRALHVAKSSCSGTNQHGRKSNLRKRWILFVLRHGACICCRATAHVDVPYGVLISGGLDSSLIAAIAARSERNAWKREGLRCHRCFGSRSVCKLAGHEVGTQSGRAHWNCASESCTLCRRPRCDTRMLYRPSGKFDV